nr:hypothetical protein CFP56_41923 [Quercus suber]
MLWKERADVCFKSYSNAHIDVVVRKGIVEINRGKQRGFMDILMQRVHRRGGRKWFMFEAMWTREEGSIEVIEMGWDPLNANPEL